MSGRRTRTRAARVTVRRAARRRARAGRCVCSADSWAPQTCPIARPAPRRRRAAALPDSELHYIHIPIRIQSLQSTRESRVAPRRVRSDECALEGGARRPPAARHASHATAASVQLRDALTARSTVQRVHVLRHQPAQLQSGETCSCEATVDYSSAIVISNKSLDLLDIAWSLVMESTTTKWYPI